MARASNTKYDLCFVIVNFRTPALVTQCIESLLPQIDWQADHIVVVDNGSNDTSVEDLRRYIAAQNCAQVVTLMCLDENEGFSGGNNVALQSVAAQAYWLTNSDTYFHPEAVLEMRNALKQWPNAGIFTPQLESPDATVQNQHFNRITPITELLTASNTGVIARMFRRHNVAIHNVTHRQTPDWVSFASIVIRSTIFQQIGYLDRNFFMYFEDVDYCLRAKAAQVSVKTVATARVVHLGGASSAIKFDQPKLKPYPKYFYSARSYYFKKHFGVFGWLAANLLWEFGYCIALFRETFGRKKKHAVPNAWRDIWITKV